MTADCPSCGEPTVGSVATGPGFEQFAPCGCRVALDGGGSVQNDADETGARSVDGIDYSATVGDQDGRCCSRTFWAYPNSGIMANNTRAYINGEIAELSALACWATWRDKLIQALIHQPRYLFRNRLSRQSPDGERYTTVIDDFLGLAID